MSAALLPPNRTQLEAAIADATAFTVDPSAIAKLWSADDCPAALLPWLAWALSVDGWELADTEAERRALIKTSIDLHRHKGTVWAVEEAIKAAGYADAQIIEGLPQRRHDGAGGYAGADSYASGQWAVFRLLLDIGEGRPISAAEAARVRQAVERWKPARAHLRDLLYRASATDAQHITDAAGALNVALQAEDVGVFGRRYNGARRHDQAARHIADGRHRHDGAIRHTLWHITGAGHDQHVEISALSVRLEDDDRAAIVLRHDAAVRADGRLRHGADMPSAIDIDMQVRVSRHLSYNGRHRHGTARHDGTRRFDAAVRHAAAIHYAGVSRTTLEA